MSEPATPPAEVEPEELCPSCGGFVGPKRRCPHCGAGIHTRLSIRLFQGGAVLVAILGLFFLYLWARNRDITEVRIGEIVETMNMAYVRVEGTVGSVFSRRDEKGRIENLQFDLDDGTGVARVLAYRHVARAMDARGLLPRRNDSASLAASIRIEPEGQVSLIIQTADHVHVRALEALLVPLADLTTALIGKSVRVEGRVIAVYPPREGSRSPYKVLLRDGEGDVPLVVWPRDWALLERKGLKEGATVLARVTVDEHSQKLQLKLEGPEDLRVEPRSVQPPPKPPRPLPQGELMPGAVKRSLLGRTVTVTGIVEKVEPAPRNSRSPHTFTLGGGGGRLAVVLWDDAFEALVRAGVVPGALVAVRGTLSEYRGTLQLKPGSPEDVTVREKAPLDAGEIPDVVGPGGVKRDWMGRTVTVRGTVSAMHRKRSGLKIVLSDGSAQLDVFVKKNLESAVPDLDALSCGGRIRVRGPVSEYKGQLQVNPPQARDIHVEDGGLRIPEPRTAASLSESESGLMVVLEGTWTKVEPIPKGTKGVLDDGSGKLIAVVIWDSVKASMREPETVLQPGRRVQVIGRVSTLGGEVQVVPQAGWDVVSKE